MAVYREAARILTLYYDVGSGAAIGPWHHAAGDFVARVSPDGRVAVRCITVRGYGAAHDFSQAGPMRKLLKRVEIGRDVRAAALPRQDRPGRDKDLAHRLVLWLGSMTGWLRISTPGTGQLNSMAMWLGSKE